MMVRNKEAALVHMNTIKCVATDVKVHYKGMHVSVAYTALTSAFRSGHF